MLDKLYQYWMMSEPFGYLPPLSDKQNMDHTWLKSSVEESTVLSMTTSENDTQKPWENLMMLHPAT